MYNFLQFVWAQKKGIQIHQFDVFNKTLWKLDVLTESVLYFVVDKAGSTIKTVWQLNLDGALIVPNECLKKLKINIKEMMSIHFLITFTI